MKTAFCLACIIALLWLGLAEAAEPHFVYTDSQFTLRIFDRPCKNETILKLIKPELRVDYRAAHLVWEGRSLESCWRMIGMFVRSVDEEGDQLKPDILIDSFQKDEGV